MTIREAKIYIREELSDFYPKNEISSLMRILFSDLFGLSSVQIISKESECFATDNITKLKEAVLRLKNYEPIQYIIGHTEFYGLPFYVSPTVLIPRPETEELVDLVIQKNKENKKLNILDIGTGSGCIAVSLAKNLQQSVVSALDISEEVLKVAERNSLENGADISFILGDLLSEVPELKSKVFDIIVSNPPYVTVSEKLQMEKNVLDFEPSLALFVDDNSPLIFYKAITKFAQQHLAPNGKLYFEINEQFGSEVKALMFTFGFSGVDVVKDINGRDRIVGGINPGFDKLNLQ